MKFFKIWQFFSGSEMRNVKNRNFIKFKAVQVNFLRIVNWCPEWLRFKVKIIQM